jgi:hypothetical protein
VRAWGAKRKNSFFWLFSDRGGGAGMAPRKEKKKEKRKKIATQP